MKTCNSENIYLYDELDAAEQEKVNDHVRTCAACRSLLEQVKANRALIRIVAERHTQPPNASALTSSIMQAIAKENTHSHWLPVLFEKFYLRYAMVAMSLVLIGWFATESQTDFRSGAIPHASIQTATLRMPSLRDVVQRRQRPRGTSIYICAQSVHCDARIVNRIKQLRNANNN
jgi:hypothetical protein